VESPIPRAVVETDGRLRLINDAFTHLLGYELDSLVHSEANLVDLFISKREGIAILEKIVARHAIRKRDVTIADNDGHALRLLLSGNLLQIDGQEFIDVSLAEITILRGFAKKLRRDHARVSSLLESITAGLFLVNMEGAIEEFNLPLANLLGMDQDGMTGSTYTAMFERLLANAVDPLVAQQDLLRSVDAVAERPVIETMMQGDPPSHIEIAFFPVWDEGGGTLGWGGLVQDVTEMRERLAWKMELLSMLGHDIRTPLATLKGHATALLSNYRNWGEAMVEDFLEAINTTTDALTRQVDRNLALTRVEAGRLGLRPQEAHPLAIVRQAEERSAGILGDRIIEMRIPENIRTIRVDPARIEEVLTILIENAVRHAPSSSAIEIGAETDGNMAAFWVKDDGPGIPPDRHQAIFEKYTQLGAGSEGAGLGLYIARKIIEAHGGKIEVSSPPEGQSHGSLFRFTVPVMPEQPPELDRVDPTSSTQIAAQGHGELILIIEDQPDMQALLHSILSQAGYDPLIAPDAKDGLDLFRVSPVELVLLDWMLPGVNGLSVCRTIRRWSQVPIIVLTSRMARADLITALNAGADDYITKPFQPLELLARINAAIRRSGEWRQEDRRDRLAAGPLVFDLDLQAAWRNGVELDLTPIEYRLLLYLVMNHGRVLTYQQIINHIWDERGNGTKKQLFVHISRLRNKIETDPKNPRHIITRWGVGYLFSPD
jgi:DNA-binding response OmpR family regulator/signal transduction histidine kinase